MLVSRWIRLTLLGGLLAASAPSTSTFAAAPLRRAENPLQQTNLLTNPGFEDGWYNWNNLGEIAIPNGWDFWYAPESTPLLDPQDAPWRRPEVVTWFYPAGFAETWFWRDGEYTLKVFGAWRPIWFRLSQTVSGLTPGAEYKFVAPAFPETVDEYREGVEWGRVFSPEANAGEWLLRTRSGGQIVSSGWVDGATVPPWQWTILSLTFVAQDTSATVEVEVRGRWGLVNNAFFLDELSLTPTGVTTEIEESSETGGGLSEEAPAEVTSEPVAVSAAPVWGATNTPQPNGEIWWEVRSGDTLAVIAYYHNTTVEAIQELNNLTSATIFPGQQLLVKVAESAVEPSPTPASTAEAEPETEAGSAPAAEAAAQDTDELDAAVAAAENAPEYGEVCVLAYADENRNAANDDEATVDGAHIVLINSDGPLDSRTSGTNGASECFRRLAPGAYRITVLAPDGLQLTTSNSSEITLQSGAVVTLAYGFSPQEPTSTDDGAERAAPLYALGAGLLLLIVAGFVGMRIVAAQRR